MHRSRCVRACVQLAVVLLQFFLAAPSSKAQGQDPVFDPCQLNRKRLWESLSLENSERDAPRDGLLFSAMLALQSPTPVLPYTDSIHVEITDAANVVQPGKVVAEWSRDGARIAFWPVAPLAPNAPYLVHITLENRVSPGCPEPGNVDRVFNIVTRSELTAAPPEPPLRAIAYGLAWSSQGRECCTPRTADGCDGQEPCAMCWSSIRFSTVVALWDAAAIASDDPLLYALGYGTLQRFDVTSATGFGFPFRNDIPPLAHTLPPDRFSPSQPEVCVTAAARNLRTGQITLRSRCTAVTNDTSQLENITLPAPLTLAPLDSTAAIGPTDCTPPNSPREGLLVAASYYTEQRKCSPACDQVFRSYAAEQRAAAAAAKAAAGAAGAASERVGAHDSPKTPAADGCATTRGPHSWGALATVFAWLYLRRRKPGPHVVRCRHPNRRIRRQPPR